MIENEAKKAIKFADNGEIRCANCGKLLFYYKKSVDNAKKSVIINVKCGRCATKNETNI